MVTGSSIYRWVSLPRPTYNSAWLYQKDRQIQSTMDKSGFGTSMLAYDSVRGDWANTSLIKSPRGHTTGSGNAQHYMLACVLLIIAGRNCVRIW